MDILALSNLLQESSCNNDDLNKSKDCSNTITPASFGHVIVGTKDEEKDKECNCTNDEIWDIDEVLDEKSSFKRIDSNDTRPQPAFEIFFKQKVGTEDVFLGTEKSPGTSDSTHIVVKIHFPGNCIKDLVLDVRKDRLHVSSKEKYVILSKFNLFIPYFS